jgi:hypothetical protein
VFCAPGRLSVDLLAVFAGGVVVPFLLAVFAGGVVAEGLLDVLAGVAAGVAPAGAPDWGVESADGSALSDVAGWLAGGAAGAVFAGLLGGAVIRGGTMGFLACAAASDPDAAPSMAQTHALEQMVQRYRVFIVFLTPPGPLGADAALSNCYRLRGATPRLH